MQLLHIDSSITGAQSVSRTLSAEIVAAELRKNPELKVVRRDLVASPLNHLSPTHLAAGQPSQDPLPEPLASDIAAGKAALAEFLASDVLVIGAPMYNFAIPTPLKAWIDRIVVAGVTFKYGASGPEGLAGGKRVIIASTRGGAYHGTPMAAFDHQEAYLGGVFKFLGITDIQFVRAEGLAVASLRDQSIAGARASIAAIR